MIMLYETVRRRLARLVTLGVIERWVHGGYVVPQAVLSQPIVIAGTAEFAALTEEFVTRLAGIGVSPRADISGIEAYRSRAGAIRG